MWLALDPPPGWTVTLHHDHREARSPDGALALEWSPLAVLPEKHWVWALNALRARVEPRHFLRTGSHEPATTADGWRVALLPASVEDAAGATLERWLAAFYYLQEHCAHAVIRAQDPVRLDAELPALRALLLAARPDFRGPLVAVRDFFTPARGR